MKILTQLDIDKWTDLVGQSTVASFFQTPSCYNFYTSMSFLEPFLYHPINLYASLKGQWQFFRNEEQKWGVMTRQGFNKKTN